MNPTIIKARELLKPTPVEIGVMPEWFARRLVRTFGHSDPQKALDFLTDYFASRREHVFDHAGRSFIHDGRFLDPETFCAEQYGVDAITMLLTERLASRLDCFALVDANAWHYPGKSIRIVFHSGLAI